MPPNLSGKEGAPSRVPNPEVKTTEKWGRKFLVDSTRFVTLLGTNISPTNALLKMIFLYPGYVRSLESNVMVMV